MTIKSNELLTAWLNTSQATHLWGVRDGDYRVDGFKVGGQYFLILQDDDGTFDVFTPLDNEQPVPQVLEQLEQYVEGVPTPGDAAWDAYVADHVEKPGDEPDTLEGVPLEPFTLNGVEIKTRPTFEADSSQVIGISPEAATPGTEENRLLSAIVGDEPYEVYDEKAAQEVRDELDAKGVYDNDKPSARDIPGYDALINSIAGVASTALEKQQENELADYAMTIHNLRRELAALKKRDDKMAEQREPKPAQEIDKKLRAAGHQAVREAMAPKRGETP